MEVHIPEDLVIRILLLLPVMSLMRFKTVCKSWYAMIKSSSFIARHLNHPCRTTNLIIKRCPEVEEFLDEDAYLLLYHPCGRNKNIQLSHLPPPPPPYYSKPDRGFEVSDLDSIVASSNGIICLQHQEFGHLALWNPATKEFRALPELPPRSYSATGCGNSLHFGFGFDVKTNDYKVVRIFWTKLILGRITEANQVDLYSLSSDSWKHVDTVVPRVMIYPNSHPKTDAKGIYCWSSWLGPSRGMLSFDLSHEVFQVTPYPPAEEHNPEYLCVLRESIAIIYFPTASPEEDLNLRIYVWNAGHGGITGSWTKIYSVPYGLLDSSNYSMTSPQFGLVSDSCGDFAILNIDRELVLFNLATQEIKRLGVQLRRGVNQVLVQVLIYKESLVSVCSGNRAA